VTRPGPAPALLLAALAACGGADQAPPPADSYTLIDAPGGGVTIRMEGVEIETAGSAYRFEQQISGGAATTSGPTLNGHPFGLRTGVFFIGEREYGPAPAGARVRVGSDGVFVDGERRGDAPPRL
jgi:hypothetical protein